MHKVVPTRDIEVELNLKGYARIAGIDEVGRGSWAGPVVAAAVILPDECELADVRDSKVLSAKQRHRVVRDIKKTALAIGIGWVASAEIDAQGLSWAVRQSGLRALADLGCAYNAVILDGRDNYLHDDCYSVVEVGADAKCLNVAAASVVAKVARDNYMMIIHRQYPHFGFDANKGYGTRQHERALAVSISPAHRLSYRPVQIALASL